MPNPMGKGCLIVSFKSSSPLNEYPEVSLYNLTFYSLYHIHFSADLLNQSFFCFPTSQILFFAHRTPAIRFFCEYFFSFIS